MNKLLSWFIIGILVLNFSICALLSYLGTGVGTASARYARGVSSSSRGVGGLLIGGGPSSGK